MSDESPIAPERPLDMDAFLNIFSERMSRFEEQLPKQIADITSQQLDAKLSMNEELLLNSGCNNGSEELDPSNTVSTETVEVVDTSVPMAVDALIPVAVDASKITSAGVDTAIADGDVHALFNKKAEDAKCSKPDDDAWLNELDEDLETTGSGFGSPLENEQVKKLILQRFLVDSGERGEINKAIKENPLPENLKQVAAPKLNAEVTRMSAFTADERTSDKCIWVKHISPDPSVFSAKLRTRSPVRKTRVEIWTR